MVSSRHLANLRAPELPGALTKDSIIVLPLGAIEQHGPHLPLNTDFVVADEVSKAAVEKVAQLRGVALQAQQVYKALPVHRV
jgi:creatinine amidohydrolase